MAITRSATKRLIGLPIKGKVKTPSKVKAKVSKVNKQQCWTKSTKSGAKYTTCKGFQGKKSKATPKKPPSSGFKMDWKSDLFSGKY
tara:strand:+ start:1441 stop:1698 length:258 start_codon:yes stop_codon:yes gene_type:complete